jgi:hypothetical protein
MSDPITIGAGLGAGLSVLQGKSPLTGALLGGVGGGMFGGAGGFGSGFGGGAASGAAGGAASGAAGSAGIVGANGQIGSSLLSGPGLTTASGQIASGAIPLTGLDKGINAVRGLTAPIENFASQNPFLARTGGNMLMSTLEGAPPPRTMQAPSPIPTQYNTSAQLDPSLVSMVQRKKYPYMIG